MAQTQPLNTSATTSKKGSLSPDILRLLDVFVQIERRRQARLQSLQKKEG